MQKLGFINHISFGHLFASEEVLKNIREFYPEAPLVMLTDGPISNEFLTTFFTLDNNTKIIQNAVRLGYAPYDKWKILYFLEKTKKGVEQLNTEYFCHIEDDCHLFRQLTIDDTWEIAGHNITDGNHIHIKILDLIYRLVGKCSSRVQYGAGGGTIMKCKTFLENYDDVVLYLDGNWGLFEQYLWPEIGYLDCFMVIYFLLSGCEYSRNTNILNIWPESREPLEIIEQKYSKKYEMVHNWKFNY
jgi:hypothetical protein